MVCRACHSPEIALAQEVDDHVDHVGQVEPSGTRRVGAAPPVDGITLELLQDPFIRFNVLDGQVVGRTSASDVVIANVPDGDAISGRMACFRKRGDQWFVEHVGSTNYLVVDGSCLKENGFEHPIGEGTTIAMPTTLFIVRLGGSSS
jgi:pSer/pThr/pTyr-binding forkhead associated (FHA) protein